MLRHLLYFTTVAEERHVGRAAGRLLMAQPPLSQALARLERSLGVRLFDRGPRGMRLTDAGRVLLPRARALLEDEAAMRRVARDLAEQGRTVRLGVVPAPGARLASALTAATRTAADDRAELTVAPARELIDAVATGAVDLAVVTHPAVTGGLEAGPVVGLPTWLLVPDGHPAARDGGPVDLAELGGLAAALGPRSHEPACHDVLVDTLDLRGRGCPVTEVESPAAGLAAVGCGWAFMLTADPDLRAEGVSRRRVAGDPLPLRLRLVWRSTGPSAAVRQAVHDRLAGAGQPAGPAPDDRLTGTRPVAVAR